MHRSFSLHHFRFHLEPNAPLRMPAYNKGNVIRGGFGSTFRRIVCHANCREPESCELRNVCPYTAVFQPFVPEGSEKIRVAESFPTRRELKVTGADVFVGNFIRSALTFGRAHARKTYTF